MPDEMNSLNSTPRSERVHIAFFGMRNAGKSSLVNAVTGQNLSVVSDVKGTTTDPVYKSMELLPLGPVTIIDTPGFDDEGALGALRVQKTRAVLDKTDIAVLAVDGQQGLTPLDSQLITEFQSKKLPFIVAYTKNDLLECSSLAKADFPSIAVSAITHANITELKEMIAQMVPTANDAKIIADLLLPNDIVILVIPVDKAAPKGRLILPEQQTIRDILDASAVAVTVQTAGLAQLIHSFTDRKIPIRMVITDSQAFREVADTVPPEIPLTSFSILFSRYKGNLEQQTAGLPVLQSLHTGDRVLISEACTHHRQCGDIGTQKLPALIRSFTGVEPVFEFSSGTEFPADLTGYRLVIHCGGCMINAHEMQSRLERAKTQQVAILNYGTAIAFMHGILKRALNALNK